MRKLLWLCLMLVSLPVFAASEIVCTGIYPTGEVFHAMLNIKANTFQLDNQDVHKIVNTKTYAHSMNLWTESFINKQGTYVYLSIYMVPPRELYITIYNAATDKLIYNLGSSCYKNN